MKSAFRLLLLTTPAILTVCTMRSADTPEVPDWAQPGSATHQQVPPPRDFHRPSTTSNKPIGIFDGQSDVGSAVVLGDAIFDPAAGRYTIDSAGYNIWYTRDEFRFLWKRLSGDLSLAANIVFPKPDGYGDRKVVLIVRQDLDDDAKEAMVALHGAGLIHLAVRPAKNTDIKEEYRLQGTASDKPVRIGLEKRGDAFALFISANGEPMHQVGSPVRLKFNQPFYAGIGFCSHLPATSDTAVITDVVFDNTAGRVR